MDLLCATRYGKIFEPRLKYILKQSISIILNTHNAYTALIRITF